MVIEYIRYVVAADRASEFEASYRRAGALLGADEHCHRWEVSRGVEEPDRYTVRIEWDSVEGHEHGFRASPGFRQFFAVVKPFVDQIAEMKHCQVLER